MLNSPSVRTQCCVVGGGPAGIMVGCLLARAGAKVVVLEKHDDFFRDFRGDTIHPSTLQLLHELGLLPRFLKLPHQELSHLLLDLNGAVIQGPDFSHLPTVCRFVAIAPQWDFLNFMSDFGRTYSTFDLRMRTEATGLILDNGRVTGVNARSDGNELQIQADLVIAADGRTSVLRQQSQLPLKELGVPIDVLWYRLPKIQTASMELILGHISHRRMLVTIDRGDYLQCATVIPKDQYPEIQSRGLAAFRADIVEQVPSLREAVESLSDWDQIKLLTVQMNRLERWFLPGLLCIGDAAHAMSPVGGVGVNIAIQDAVATANLLSEPLRAGQLTQDDLKKVQNRREWPARMTQRLQAFAHRRIFNPKKGFGQTAIFSAPAQAVLGLFAPLLRRELARIIGLGFRPEHIQSADIHQPGQIASVPTK